MGWGILRLSLGRSALLALLTTLVVVAALWAAKPAAASGYVYSVSARYPVAGGSGEVAVDPTLGYVYVLNQTGSVVTVMNETTGATVGTIDLGATGGAVAVDPGLNALYVTLDEESQMLVYNATTLTSDNVVVQVGKYPDAATVDTTSHQVYVANNGDRTVTIVNGTTYATTTVASVESFALDADPATNTAYVADEVSPTVDVITNGTVRAAWTFGQNGLDGVAVDPSRDLLYVNSGSSLYIADASDGTILNTIQLPSDEYGGLAIDSSTDTIYVQPWANNQTLAIVDGSSDTVVSTLPIGSMELDQMAVDSTSHAAFLSYNSASLAVVTPQASTTSTTLAAPGTVGAGAGITLSATVSPAPNSGTVAFSFNGQTITGCSAQTPDPTTGVATCATTAPTAPGSYSVGAAYAGGLGYGTSSGSGTLTVTAGALSRIILSSSSSQVTAGTGVTYTAKGLDQYGNETDVTSQTTFSIAPDGTCAASTCTATIAGSHTVTGTDGSVTGTATQGVTAGLQTSIVVSPASSSIAAGGSQTYTATAEDQYGNAVGNVTSKTAFSIAPDGSCTNATATCTANVAGSHTVTATEGAYKATASLTVTAGAVSTIVLSPSSSTVAAGIGQTYTAAGYDQYNNPLGDVTNQTTFTISSRGTCTANTCSSDAAGSYAVTGNDGSVTGTASLTVSPGPLSSLVLSPATATITAGGSQIYTATGYDQYGNSLGNLTAQTTFSIAPDGSCTNATETCTATTAGAHTVTGQDGSVTGTAALTVNPGAAATVIIAAGDNQSAATSKAFPTPLSVAVTDSYGNPVPNAQVVFAITPNTGGTANFGGTTQSVTVTTSSSGSATALALYAGSSPGSVIVTASTGGVGTSFMETVTASGPSRADLAVTISVSTRTLGPGATATITVTVTNRGPQAATNVVTGLLVPPAVTIANPAGGTVRYGLDEFTASSLASGKTLTYVVTVKAGSRSGPVLLLAGTGSAITDPNLFNNFAIGYLTVS